MKRPLLMALAILSGWLLAFTWPQDWTLGYPFATGSVTVTPYAAVNLPATVCRPGGTTGEPEYPGMIQVLTGAMFLKLGVTAGTPASTDNNFAIGDVMVVAQPSRVRAVGNAATGTLIVTCFAPTR